MLNSSVDDLSFVLIVRDSCSSKFLAQIHTNKHICGIFLYSNRINSFVNIKVNKYDKVIDIVTQRKELQRKLAQFVYLYRYRLRLSWVYYGPFQKTIRAIGCQENNEEKNKFIWFQLFKQLIIQFDNDPSSWHDLINQLHRRCFGNESQFRHIETFKQDYCSAKAIYWYSKSDLQLYRIVNRALRTEDPIELFNYRLFIRDMSNQMRTLWKKEKRTSSVIVYRGSREMKIVLRRLRENIGNVIALNGFLSCSKSRHIAELFGGINEELNDNEIPVIYEIEVDSSIVMADISEESQFPDEKEVLFDLGMTFKVISVKCDSKETYWIVQLKATVDGSSVANEFIDFNQLDLKKDKSIEVFYGQLLIETGEFIKARYFFENLVKYQRTADAYYYMGRICSVLGEYDLSEKFFKFAFDELQTNSHSRSIDMMRVINGLGFICSLQGNFDQAYETYEKALQQGKILFPNYEHYEFIPVLNNIASVLEDQGKYDQAIQTFEQILIICDQILLHPDHPKRALAYDNLGNIYTTIKNYDLSLQCLFKAFSIRLKLLPRGHFDYGWNFMQLGRVFIYVKQFECARLCLNVAFDIMSVTVPKNHLNKAEYLLQFGNLNQEQKYFRRALVWYRRALTARLKLLPSDHRDIGVVYEKIGDSLRALGRIEEAVENYQRALKIYIDKLLPDHPFTAHLKETIIHLI
ncbi:unnamed protein product [Adineta steineri]|uniref:NAD(P)(+)--arginine ADP-ribosyltransferase n=1 Tax=Adineta steineri TaxID=433720 RepID=A0A819RD37_9BILA|nr:unnamed protein product [Adineta steineri]CAF4037356.1 unnamed protein product [Adineta steineri]